MIRAGSGAAAPGPSDGDPADGEPVEGPADGDPSDGEPVEGPSDGDPADGEPVEDPADGGGPLERADLAAVAVRLAALLRAAGVPVGAERAGRFAAAVSLAAPATVRELYWLARVSLVAERDHLDAFSRVFAQVFEGLVDPASFRGDAPPPTMAARPSRARPGTPPGTATPPATGVPAAGEGGATGDAHDGRELVLAARSHEERLHHQDFAKLSPEELAQVRDLAAALSLAPPPRRARRRVRGPKGRQIDVRATLRRARRTGGLPFVTERRRPQRKPRKVVLVCDISGSMEPYARAYLQLLVSGVRGARAEVFVFATRLTRLTPQLRDAHPDVALERAGRAAPDWSGGTRIGAAMKAFNDRYGRRGLARGAIVLVLSDGWDTGDPGLLGEEMARLRRLAFRVVWVNPRKAAPGYEPLTAGMAAALPHVDAFVSGHSRAALDEVLAAVAAG